MKEQIPLNPNYIKYQQSDIFIQKGLSKPEIKYTHKRIIPKNTFDSSYNFLYWKDMSPHFDENIKIKVNQNNVSQILHSNAEKYINKDLNLIGSKLKHKAFYDKMYENEPDKNIDKSTTLNKTLNKRYQKETMFLGNYAGDEYKIKKNKTVIYKPTNDYLKQETPLQTKMDFIYRSSEGIIGNPKSIINHKNKIECPSSSIGYLKREFETINDRDTKIINDPKKMKYFNIYGNNGIENVNTKLKSMKKSKTTNNFYTPGIDCTKNRINFLKSNIFHDEEIDIKNNEDKNNKYSNKTYKSIKVNRQSQKRKIYKRANSTSKLINKYYNTINNERNNNNININTNNNKTDEDIINIKNNSRKFLYGKNGEDNLPIKLDWRDDKTYLLFPQSKNRDIIKQNPRQKKFKNLYGSQPTIPKQKLGEEFNSDQRKEVEQMAKNYYKDINYSKMKKICGNISQFQINDNNKILNEQINYNKNDIKTKIYEIIQRKNKDNYNIINIEEIRKKFANKGIHIYDIEENMNIIMDNKIMNKINFKIRDNKNDKTTTEKIKQIKQEFDNDKIIMKEKIENKKENNNYNDIMPIKLNWNAPHCDLITKYKKLKETNDGITHLKGRYDNTEEEKITRICVNLKYKNRNINN